MEKEFEIWEYYYYWCTGMEGNSGDNWKLRGKAVGVTFEDALNKVINIPLKKINDVGYYNTEFVTHWYVPRKDINLIRYLINETD